MEPEILAIPDEVIARFCEEEPGIRDYEVRIREIRRMKEHTLSKEMEQLLASAGEMAQTASNGFGMLSNADLKFPPVKDSSGNEIQLSNGRFVPLQMSPDRELRRESFEKFYTRYSEFANTWAAMRSIAWFRSVNSANRIRNTIHSSTANAVLTTTVHRFRSATPK